jgi:pantoate--beta-alanine ligase
VSTIVHRLFEDIASTRAYFGQKDFQQTLVVRDLARARGSPEVVVCPTSREISGLARSSRNQLLSASERLRAAGLFAALGETRDAWQSGERRAEALDACLRASLASLEFEVEYAQVRDPEVWTADACSGPMNRAIALLAARVGRTRLIDNLRLDEPASGVR